MTIQGIKELTFEQAFLKTPIPRDGVSHEKYIAKDFVLELGDVKIKLKASDSLRDVVRKINLKSHVTGIRAKTAKGKLALESTRKGRGQRPSITGITLSKKDSGEGFPVNANQIIANYLASLPTKISTGTQAGEPIGLYVINEANEEDEVSGNTTINGIVRFSVDKANECSKSIYSLVNSILCQESRVLSSVLLPQLFFLLSGTLSIYCLTFLMRLQIC